MRSFPIYQVDAFTDELFRGNPAAVVVLDAWIDQPLMQKISAENNLSETAFVVRKEENYEIRWFTPESEVALCGHATLASAYVLFKHYEKESSILNFETMQRGQLSVTRSGDLYELDFPADNMKHADPPIDLITAMGKQPEHCLKGITDYMLVYRDEATIRDILPDFDLIKASGARGVIVTAPGSETDFVSRFFAPAVGINEDPVTGSAHTSLIPYWAERLRKESLSASQLSKRGGLLFCRSAGDRVKISGKARLYLKGDIVIE
jgi:PhzF family phenazine biosynthesis protein